MYDRVIALDPGGTTGWAMWTKDVPLKFSHYNIGQIGPHEHHSELYAFLESMHIPNTAVICESFEFRQNRQRDNINLMSKEYIGVTKLFGAERNVPVVFQTAATAKTFVTDQKLKAMGLYVPSRKHAMDAMRHMITYMINKMGRTDLVESWRNL